MGLVASHVNICAEYTTSLNGSLWRAQSALHSSSGASSSYVDTVPSSTHAKSNKILPEIRTTNSYRPSFRIGHAYEETSGVPNTRSEEENTLHAGEALKVIINNDGSRRALIKFLHRQGLENYLNYYFEVEDLRETTNIDEFWRKAEELQFTYISQRILMAENDAVRESWILIMEKLKLAKSRDARDLLQNFISTQTYVVSLLSCNLDNFVHSKYYREWENAQQKQEFVSKKVRVGASTAINKPSSDVVDTMASKYKTILVVEDSNVAAKLICRSLKSNGHSVILASNGRAALEVLRTEKVDLMLTDLFMPIMDGFETVKEFKKAYSELTCYSPRGGVSVSDAGELAAEQMSRPAEEVPNEMMISNKNMLIIGMSVDIDPRTTSKAMRAGVDIFMEKPFSLKKMSNLLHAPQTQREQQEATVAMKRVSRQQRAARVAAQI